MSEHLDYYWTFSLYHTGNRQLITPRNIFCGWKPILIFQNGFRKLKEPLDDIITGTGLEKEYHEWQQSERELIPIIENFTNPGETILDPFAGSGTTLLAAKKLNRKPIGIELDKDHYKVAVNRIKQFM